jgi:hypothetical protein
MTVPPDTEIPAALAELKQATAALGAASTIVSRARSEEIECLNRVNAAQKKLDALVLALKQEAPRESDWRNALRRGQVV